MDRAVGLHFEVLHRAMAAHGGVVVKSTGDGIFARFGQPLGAVLAAATVQRDLAAIDWPGSDVQVRIGIHTGECIERGGDLYGPSVNRAARIEQAAYGGQILLSETTAALVRDQLADDLWLDDLGQHHFDGILDATRVYQLSVGGLPRRHPPLRTLDLGLDRLPPELTPLVGRDAAVVQLRDDLRRHRLVSLVGPPGVGKTRLAVRTAGEEARYRDHGVQFVDLSPVREQGTVAELVASHLGVRPGEADDATDSLLRALRTSDALLVLDTCEHVRAEVAQLVDALVGACPRLVVLTTTRERLDLPYEVAWPVRPLEVPAAGGESVADLAAVPAVQLLVERARGEAGPLVVAPADAAALAAICRRCDGLPLALELAAARLQALTPQELLAELERSIDVLAGSPSVDALGGRGGLLEALDASYAALAPHEQQLFDQLSVFAGPATSEAIAAVCGVDGTRDLLEGLVRRSMVTIERSGPRSRFRLLEPVRQFAVGHMRVDDELQRRHTDFFLAEAERRGAQYRGADGTAAARALVDQLDDLRLAVRRLSAARDWHGAARIVLALHAFCLFSLRPELYSWAVDLDGRLEDADPLAAELQGILAVWRWFRGEHQAAVDTAERALATADLADGPVSRIWAHTAMVNAASHLGDLDAATRHLAHLQRECYATGDPYWLINANAVQAVGLATVGLHELAVDPAAEAVRLAEQLGNAEGRYWAAYAQALALRPTDLDGAEEALARSLAAARSNGSRFNEGNVLVEQLSIHVERGRLDAAAATALDLLAHLERAGGFGQIWQVVLLGARTLADARRDAVALLLFAAVIGRPRAPHLAIDRLLALVEHDLAGRVGAEASEQIRTRAAFLTDAEIIESCRDGLTDLLRG
jgi:predicted ATPase